jgi:long-chain acyl-CoA synthetase
MFLHGNSNQNYAVAVMTPRKDKLAQIASKIGVQGSVEELCKNNAVRIAILSELTNFARSNGLLGFQLAKNIFL